MEPKLIRNEADYRRALARLDELMDAERGTPEFDELEVLSVLIERYEDEQFPIGLPDPVEAIRFRMEQADLKPKDLVPYIGSPSRVSEILRGTRPLTLRMIRALHENLGIPAEVLLREPGARLPERAGLDVEKLPWTEMVKRGWFRDLRVTAKEAKDKAEELSDRLFGKLAPSTLQAALFRRHVRSGAVMDSYALLAWTARVACLAQNDPLPAAYRPGTLDEEFTRRLVQLSYFDDGPRLAREFLRKHGVHLVIERQLPRTRIDGAASLLADGTPVVALTLRHDRLDHFWFSLYHELAHVALHLGRGEAGWFVDDLDLRDGEQIEREADQWALDRLIPPEEWSRIRGIEAAPEVIEEAHRLKIHPAIIAGRVRWEARNFRLLARLVGRGEVRRQFPEARSD